jgi:hypothetical protein
MNTDTSALEQVSVTTLKFFPLLLTKYHSGDEVKKTEMGRTCGTNGGEERCIQGFSGET